MPVIVLHAIQLTSLEYFKIQIVFAKMDILKMKVKFLLLIFFY